MRLFQKARALLRRPEPVLAAITPVPVLRCIVCTKERGEHKHLCDACLADRDARKGRWKGTPP